MASLLHTIVIYPLYLIIEVIYKLFLKLSSNQGVSVIGVSVGITLLCLPLYAVAEHWQQVERDVQKKMKDGLERIKKTFTGDERYMMTQTFYRQHHYSPIMALRSSFGLLIQIPFFMAAYQFLSGLEALKGVSFLFIRDMGAQDATFHIGSFPVNVLPIAMTLINMAAGIVYTKGLALREKIQVHGMAVIFLAILYNSPSGLVLYWTMNNVFSLVKNVFYKLKNPVKVFWISSCALCSAAFVYIAFFYTTKTVFKLALYILSAVGCLLTILMLRVVWTFNSYELIYVITEGGPASSSETLTSYLFTRAYSNLDFGAASALGLMFALVLLICAGIYMKLTKFSKAGDF